MQNPLLFDREITELVCTRCKFKIFPIESGHHIGVTMEKGNEFFYWTIHERIDAIIRHRIAGHKCEPEQAAASNTFPGLRRLNEEPLPAFALGSICINVHSGYMWRIEEESELDTIIRGWKAGSRTVKLYL
jgi:hypothetical protein